MRRFTNSTTNILRISTTIIRTTTRMTVILRPTTNSTRHRLIISQANVTTSNFTRTRTTTNRTSLTLQIRQKPTNSMISHTNRNITTMRHTLQTLRSLSPLRINRISISHHLTNRMRTIRRRTSIQHTRNLNQTTSSQHHSSTTRSQQRVRTNNRIHRIARPLSTLTLSINQNRNNSHLKHTLRLFLTLTHNSSSHLRHSNLHLTQHHKLNTLLKLNLKFQHKVKLNSNSSHTTNRQRNNSSQSNRNLQTSQRTIRQFPSQRSNT